MNLSIIIPTYNEAGNIAGLIKHLLENSNEDVVDVIVSDGGSTDETIAIAKHAGANAVVSPGKGRAAQMNYGAQLATGHVFYFIHADCFPPSTYVTDIKNAINAGYDLGRYRTKFNSESFILKINAWFTRFDLFICMGGDQTLFVKRSLFELYKGYNESMKIMEDYDFCERARSTGKYRIIPKSALVSARKYDTNSWLQVQVANAKIVNMYKKGAGQQEMVDTYKQLLSYRKNAF